LAQREGAQGDGADVVVAPFNDPIGRDAVIIEGYVSCEEPREIISAVALFKLQSCALRALR
jgi:hypothetical protein